MNHITETGSNSSSSSSSSIDPQHRHNGIVRSFVARDGVIQVEIATTVENTTFTTEEFEEYDSFVNKKYTKLLSKKPTPGWEFVTSSWRLPNSKSSYGALNGMKFHIYDDYDDNNSNNFCISSVGCIYDATVLDSKQAEFYVQTMVKLQFERDINEIMAENIRKVLERDKQLAAESRQSAFVFQKKAQKLKRAMKRKLLWKQAKCGTLRYYYYYYYCYCYYYHYYKNYNNYNNNTAAAEKPKSKPEPKPKHNRKRAEDFSSNDDSSDVLDSRTKPTKSTPIDSDSNRKHADDSSSSDDSSDGLYSKPTNSTLIDSDSNRKRASSTTDDSNYVLYSDGCPV